MEKVFEAINLTKYYPVRVGGRLKGQKVKALDGVSFTLEEGNTLAVVGESGCGKSTLARLVTMIETPTAGEINFLQHDKVIKTAKGRIKDLRKYIQIVFQDPYGSLNPRKKIGSILAEPLVINTNLSRFQRRQKIFEMMEKVGLRPGQADRYPHMFSGGQRQRVAIARALMLEPRIIVLDEPVSALDISIQAQVLNLLEDLQKEFKFSYLFISHDLSVVRHIATDVLVMYLGKVVEMNTVDKIFNNPQHPYTKALLSATPIADPDLRRDRIKLTGELPSPLNPPSGCAFNPRCPYTYDLCLTKTPILKSHNGGIASCHLLENG